MSDVAKKRGRPVKVDCRNRRLMIRVTEEEAAMLDRIVEKTGMTRSNILRAALRLYYSMRFE